MPLETATYVDDLVATNPADTDNESQGAAHLRLVKNCLKNSFPNLGSAAVNATAAQLNAIQSAIVGSGTTLSVQNVNGGVPMGTVHMFARDPGTTLCARGGTATGTEQFILLDGATYAQSKFPNLGASGFVTVSAPNFTVDNLLDTNRFIRAGSASTIAPGTKQSNQNAAHTHGTSAITLSTTGAHTHTATSTDSGHTHPVGNQTTISANLTAGSAETFGGAGAGNTGTGAANITTTIASAGNHTHTISGNTDSQGGTEARPESFAAFICIKT